MSELPDLLLRRLWRIGAGFVGLGGLTSGGAAVYITHVEAGPVALLAVGALFALVAMVGRVPWSGGIGNAKWQWTPQKEELSDVLVDLLKRDGLRPADAEVAIARVERAAPDIGYTVQRTLTYTATVEQVLAEIAVRHEAAYRSADAPFDGMLVSNDGLRRILVLIKPSLNSLGAPWLQVIHMQSLMDSLYHEPVARLLIVAGEPLSNPLMRTSASSLNIEVAYYTGESSKKDLERVVTIMLTAPNA